MTPRQFKGDRYLQNTNVSVASVRWRALIWTLNFIIAASRSRWCLSIPSLISDCWQKLFSLLHDAHSFTLLWIRLILLRIVASNSKPEQIRMKTYFSTSSANSVAFKPSRPVELSRRASIKFTQRLLKSRHCCWGDSEPMIFTVARLTQENIHGRVWHSRGSGKSGGL